MLTYQLQKRVLSVEEGGRLTYPADLNLELLLDPAAAFGCAHEPGRIGVAHQEIEAHFDSNLGRGAIQPAEPLPRVDVEVRQPGVVIRLEGNRLRYQACVASREQLVSSIETWYYVFPALLAVFFPDPPVVREVSGRLGATDFRWVYEQTPLNVRILDAGFSMACEVEQAIHWLPLMSGTNNRRLAAALTYHRTAVRLSVAGSSPWEFMAEVVLNYCKCLDVLFGPRMDDVRSELPKLGYTSEEIEKTFVPMLVLRNHFDVGHAKLSLPRQEQLRVLYQFLISAENKFRDLMKCVLEHVTFKRYVLRQHGDLNFDTESQKKFDQLIQSISA